MPRLKHYDGLGNIRFVTFSCHKRLTLITRNTDCRIILKQLNKARQKYNFKLFSYVLMPEHVHLVMLPENDCRLGNLVGEIKSLSAREILTRWQQINHPLLNNLKVIRNGMVKHAFWQKRCFDFNCRTKDMAIEKINYCHKNPVQRGLVLKPEEWKWSSYKWYLNQKEPVLQIDTLEI